MQLGAFCMPLLSQLLIFLTLFSFSLYRCSALNYMTSRSRGCALWIGLNMHKASARWSKEKLRRYINATSFNLSDFLKDMKRQGMHPSMQLQFPSHNNNSTRLRSLISHLNPLLISFSPLFLLSHLFLSPVAHASTVHAVAAALTSC